MNRMVGRPLPKWMEVLLSEQEQEHLEARAEWLARHVKSCQEIDELKSEVKTHEAVGVGLMVALMDIEMLARREIARLLNAQCSDGIAVERWRHVQRFCNEAGITSPGVLREDTASSRKAGEPS